VNRVSYVQLLECDGCRAEYFLTTRGNYLQVEHAARADGWQVARDHHLCPACAARLATFRCQGCADRGWQPGPDGFTPIDCPECHGQTELVQPVRILPRWDSPETIAGFRRCIAVGREQGWLTAEEYAVATGNLDEAAATLRLRSAAP
jgi:hypothetical protein